MKGAFTFKTLLAVIFVIELSACSGSSSSGLDADGNNPNSDTPSANAKPVSLYWQSPTKNVDSSCISQLQGYKLHYGTSSGAYGSTTDLPLNTGLVSCEQTGYDATCGTPIMACSYTTESLEPGTWYFVTQTYDLSGNHSGLSNEVSTLIN